MALELSSKASKKDVQVRDHFVGAFVTGGGWVNRLHTSAFAELLIFALLSFFYIRKTQSPIDKKRYALFFSLIALGLVIYSMGLLILYMNAYSTFEAMKLASFGRYMHIYLVAMSLIICLFWLNKIKYFDRRVAYKMVLPLLLLGMVYIIASKPHGMKPIRVPLVKLSNQVAKVVPIANSNLYIVYQNDTHTYGYPLDMMAYQLFPRVTAGCFSLGKPYGKWDIWTCDWSLKQFKNTMKNYKYILLAHTDENFWDHYGLFFKSKTGQTARPYFGPSLYRLTYKNNQLEAVRIKLNNATSSFQRDKLRQESSLVL